MPYALPRQDKTRQDKTRQINHSFIKVSFVKRFLFVFTLILSIIFNFLFLIPNKVSATGSANSPWPAANKDSQHTSRINKSYGYITSKWKSSGSGGMSSSIILSDGSVAFMGSTVYVVNSSDGSIKWSKLIDSNFWGRGGGVVTNNGVIYKFDANNSYSNLYALSETDGSTLWSTGTWGHGSAAMPAIDSQGNIYATSWAKNLRSYDSSGSLRWSKTIGSSTFNFASPTIDSDDNIYVGANNGGMYAFDISGNQLWYYNIPSKTCSTALFYSNNIYFVCTNGYLYNLNKDGELVWSLSVGATDLGNYRPPVAGSDNSIYYADSGSKKLSKVDSGGNLEWQVNLGYGAYAGISIDSDNHLYIGTTGGGLHIYSSSGQFLEKITGTASYSAPFMDNSYIYDTSGYAFQPWTISLNIDNLSPSIGDTVNFTATTSMLKRDPAASVDNLVQVYIPNGDKVSLSYDSADSSNTYWKGSYVIPSSLTSGLQDAVAEAVSYNTTTNQTLHFTSLPTGFNNSGVSTSTCFASGGGSCEPSITLDNNPQPAPEGKIRLTGKATLTAGNYNIGSVQYSINDGGFSDALPTDGSFNSTSEEFYFDFDPKSNQKKDDQGNLIDGYTVRVKVASSHSDTTDNLFYFSQFNLNEPLDNTITSLTTPTFDFSVIKLKSILKENLSKYQIQVRKGGSDSTVPWEVVIDDIPIDGILDITGTVVVDNDKLKAVYTDDSSRIKVYSKVETLAGSMQWKAVAVDKTGHGQDSPVRSLRVNTKNSVTTNSSPLAILNISGIGNPNISTTNLSAIKDTYYLGSINPIFYGIAYTDAKVILSLTEQDCHAPSGLVMTVNPCTKTYSTIANQDSRYGINIPKGDLKWGKKYTVNMSVMLNQDYNELPSFTLSTSGFTQKNISTPIPAINQQSKENNIQQIIPTPIPTPIPLLQKETTLPQKNCLLFICW